MRTFAMSVLPALAACLASPLRVCRTARQRLPLRMGPAAPRSALVKTALGLRGGADAAGTLKVLAWYSAAVAAYPIRTKALTAGLVFAASDLTAQRV